jgi:hypothetical protein
VRALVLGFGAWLAISRVGAFAHGSFFLVGLLDWLPVAM